MGVKLPKRDKKRIKKSAEATVDADEENVHPSQLGEVEEQPYVANYDDDIDWAALRRSRSDQEVSPEASGDAPEVPARPLPPANAGSVVAASTYQKGSGMSDDASELAAQYASQVDRSDGQRLQASLTETADQARGHGQWYAGEADRLRARAAGLANTEGLEGEANSLRSQAAEHDEDAQKRIGIASSFENWAASVMGSRPKG